MKGIKEKIAYVRDNPNIEEVYYELLHDVGCDGMHYWDYMHNGDEEGISIDDEMKYLKEGDFFYACALLTAILREDHFSNGAIYERLERGQVAEVLNRMIETADELKNRITLINGSCADQVADACVNAANGYLQAGGGICGVIFRKAGYEELSEVCSKYKTPVKDGEAVITPAFNIKNAKVIIHAVGSNFGKTPKAFKELFDAYFNSLLVLKENSYHSIAFPLISAGIFGGNLENPVAESTKQCCRAYKKFIYDFPDYFIDVKLCAFTSGEMRKAQEEFAKH